MALRVSGKNINIGAALQQRIVDRVEEATSKISVAAIPGAPLSAATASDSAPNA